MPKKPDGLCGKNHLCVPDAQTVQAFVAQARQVWHAAHPIKKNNAGRPLAQASDLSRAADSLVREELESRPRQLSSKETKKRLIQTLAEQFIDCDESTIRRQVDRSLIDEKAYCDLTKQDMAKLRRKGEARSMEQVPAAFEAFMQRFPSVLHAIKREFPDQWKASEQTGKPLTMGEIKRLYAAKENGRPLTLEMLRPTSTPRR